MSKSFLQQTALIEGKAPSLLETVIAESFETTAVTRQEWDDFVLSIRGDVYMSFDWCRIWWRHYGRGRALRLFVFREEGRLVGLAPMFVERVWLGLVGLKLGKRVGADYALSIFSLPIAADFVEVVYAKIVSSLTIADRCDAVWIGFCPSDDPTLSGLRAGAASLSDLVSMVRDAAGGIYTVFELAPTFDAYLKTLDGNKRHNYRRRLKPLTSAFRIESEVVSDPSRAAKSFAEFKAAHQEQWTAEGKLGHFGDWPHAAEFHRELVDSLSKTGRFRMVCLKAAGDVVARQYAYVFGDRCHSRLSARTTKEEFEKFGLGVLSKAQLIQVMIDEKVRFIEAGPGHYDYKVRLGGKELNAVSCLLVANRASSLLRSKLFLLLSEALNIAYYKIWFIRFAPHFPMLRRPLWRMWIRSRL